MTWKPGRRRFDILPGRWFRSRVDPSAVAALHAALRDGDQATAVRLLDSDARLISVGLKDYYGAVFEGILPLQTAAAWGQLSMVRLLVSRGAGVNATNKSCLSRTALHMTAEAGHVSVAQLLIQSGADVNARVNDRRQAWPLFQGGRRVPIDGLAHPSPSAGEDHGRTALHVAIVNQKSELSKLLLANGADARANDASGQTPLHRAALVGDEATAVLLLSRGADANAKDLCRSTPLHLAMMALLPTWNVALAARLQRGGADPNAKNRYGYTPLHVAAFSGCSAGTQLLVENGADVNARDDGGLTPLYWAEVMDPADGPSPSTDAMCGIDPERQKAAYEATIEFLRQRGGTC